jgi:hypothetical protein
VCEQAFEARRVVRSYRQTIEATPDAVFPLLCPAREKDWLDGWDYTMIYSSSGLAEEGAVFTTSIPGEAETVWVIARHDRARGLVEFVRVTPGSRACVLRAAVSPRGKTSSFVDVSYEYTSIASPGNRFLDDWTEDSFLRAVVFWEKSMNHFLKTGERLSRTAA